MLSVFVFQSVSREGRKSNHTFKVTSSLLGQALIFHDQEWCYYHSPNHPQLPQSPDGHIVTLSRLTITSRHSAFLQIRLAAYLS